MTVFVANTNVLELQGLKNAILDEFINDADVTVTVLDADGAEVVGQTWPATMNYVAASDGWYRAIISDLAGLEDKEKFTAVIDADGGPDLIGHWEFPFTPITRTKK